MSENTCVVCLVTVPDKDCALKITKGLLDKKLVACVNRLGPIESTYWWEGKIDSSSEFLLIIKTTSGMKEDIIAHVKKVHPYTVPEIIFLPIENGNQDYLGWIADSVGA